MMSHPKSVTFVCPRCDLSSDSPSSFNKNLGAQFWVKTIAFSFLAVVSFGAVCHFWSGKFWSGAFSILGLLIVKAFYFSFTRCPRCGFEGGIKEKYHY
jgi:hypothetical protein